MTMDEDPEAHGGDGDGRGDGAASPARPAPADRSRRAGSARRRVWRSRRRVLVGAFLTALGAALATQAVTRLDQGLGSVLGDDEPPEPLAVRADPLACPPFFALPEGVSVPEMQRKVDELTGGDDLVVTEDWEGFREGLLRLGAEPRIEELDLVVRSSLSDDVVLKRVQIEVVERSETDSVPSFFVPGGCGDLSEHHYAVDLDDARPRLSPDTFSYTVHRRDTVRIRLKIDTAHTDCRWRLHLDWDGPRGAETTTLPGGKATYRSYPVQEDDAAAVAPGLTAMPTDLGSP